MTVKHIAIISTDPIDEEAICLEDMLSNLRSFLNQYGYSDNITVQEVVDNPSRIRDDAATKEQLRFLAYIDKVIADLNGRTTLLDAQDMCVIFRCVINKWIAEGGE